MKLKKILVALDSSNGTVHAMKVGAELANKAEAELQALYIEDIEWFEASQHSFTQQISSYTGEITPFSEENLTVQLRALKRLLETTVTDMGKRMNIRYSYQSVRGVVNKELLEAASHVDLVIIGRSGYSLAYRQKLGSTARELADRSPVPVLVWNSNGRWPQSFIGLCTTPGRSGPVIDWAIKLAEIVRRRAHLFWPSDTTLNDDELKQVIPSSIALQTVKAASHFISDLTPEGLRYYRNELLIISRDNLTQSPGEYLEAFANSVLLL